MSTTISPVQSAAAALGQAATAADARTDQALADLARRVAALEQVTRPVPSPDGAQAITPQTVLITADFCQWRLAGASGAYTVQWLPLGAAAWAAAGTTASVTRLECWKGLLHHTSPNASSLSTPGWWRASVTGTTVAWVEVPGDPSLAPVVPPVVPPTPGTGFTIGPSVPMPTDGAVNINLSAPTGFVVGPELWGVSQSTNGASGHASWDASFANAGWVSAMAALGLRSWRLQGEMLLGNIFPSPSSATGANWSYLDPLIANMNKAFPNARKMWTIVDPGMTGYATAAPAIVANQVGQLADYLEKQGVHIDYWDMFNEPDGAGSPHATEAQCRDVGSAVFTTLAARNKGYKFGSSPTTSPIIGSYTSAAVAGFPALDYLSGHWYAGRRDRGEAGAIANDLFLSTDPWWSSSVLPGETIGGKKYPFALTEFALGYGGGGFLGAESTNMAASCMYAALLAFGAARNIFWAAHVWDAAQSVYGFPGNLAAMAPHVYMIAKAGQTMPGNVVASNNSLGLVVLATTAGIMVVNTSTTTPRSGKVSIGGLANTSLHLWQQKATDAVGGFSFREGVTVAQPATALAAQTFPPLSVTVYSP